MMDELVEKVARAIWGHVEWERLSDEYGGVPFDEIWSRMRYLHVKERLVIAARSAIAVMPGWKPIETAPKDSTPVLVTTKYGVRIAYYGTEYSEMLRGEKLRWWQRRNLPCDPVYWMPLPAPPSNATCDDQEITDGKPKRAE
jgi:hypothetical protein